MLNFGAFSRTPDLYTLTTRRPFSKGGRCALRPLAAVLVQPCCGACFNKVTILRFSSEVLYIKNILFRSFIFDMKIKTLESIPVIFMPLTAAG